MMENESTPIVILGECDTHEMYKQIRITYPEWRHHRVYCREGDPCEIDDLDRVSIADARTVIVLGPSRNPRMADNKVITTVLAIQVKRCIPFLNTAGCFVILIFVPGLARPRSELDRGNEDKR